MGMAIVMVDLVVDELVAPEHHRGLHAPHHKVVVIGIVAGHIFLNGKIERQLTDGSGWGTRMYFIIDRI
jgi:hypothetical protein